MKKYNKDDPKVILFALVLLALLALCPPIGVILIFCIVLSDGTVEGMTGCLTPIIVIALIALAITWFD